ncbi:hypothetical protein NHH82_21490 [Oxalobacteraceae bacterium OTU3REALA1]|nr:hypothetical protein NHH82_21490 [Oxalobacteraceae bacterium OTU3REALA1]
MQQADRYHEALSMQRHYDSLSQAAITAMAAVAGGTPVLYKSLGLPVAGLTFFAAIPLLYIAMKIYEGCDVHAAYALRVAGIIEASDDPNEKPTVNGKTFHGPAHAFIRRGDFELQTTAGGKFHSLISKFFWGATSVFIILGCSSLYFDLDPIVKKYNLAEKQAPVASRPATQTSGPIEKK